MLTLTRKQLQITPLIIAWITVLVVDNLSRLQQSPQSLLHHDPMLATVCSINTNHHVAIGRYGFPTLPIRTVWSNLGPLLLQVLDCTLLVPFSMPPMLTAKHFGNNLWLPHWISITFYVLSCVRVLDPDMMTPNIFAPSPTP
jgi:hypothetical protein